MVVHVGDEWGEQGTLGSLLSQHGLLSGLHVSRRCKRTGKGQQGEGTQTRRHMEEVLAEP